MAKAYDSVSHNWLIRTLELHKISNAIKNTIVKLSHQWKTSLTVKNEVGVRLTDPIQFKRGIYQGDTLCHYFSSCALILWRGNYEPMDIDISHSFFIDDLKLYSGSER